MNSTSKVAIIGGSGLYQIQSIEDIKEIEVETPFGSPSDKIVSGYLHGVNVLFLPRHGKGHLLTPTNINYRANIYALKKLGAEWCIGVSAVGSLVEQFAPGHIVIPDQIIDRTRHRQNTFFEDGIAAHISFADPYCPVLTKVLCEVCQRTSKELDFAVHTDGTFVCMEGPAFSTRAESFLYKSWGASIIGMTCLPEAKLAREAEMAYATLALVTDYDCWKEGVDDVEVSHVLETLEKNSSNAKIVVSEVVKELINHKPSDLAARALAGAIISDLSAVLPTTVERLRPIIGKYLQ